jgi:hypothetical protein
LRLVLTQCRGGWRAPLVVGGPVRQRATRGADRGLDLVPQTPPSPPEHVAGERVAAGVVEHGRERQVEKACDVAWVEDVVAGEREAAECLRCPDRGVRSRPPFQLNDPQRPRPTKRFPVLVSLTLEDVACA